MNIWLLIFAIGAAQGLLLTVALWQRGGRAVSDRLLAGWMLLVVVDLAVRAWAMADPGVHTFKPRMLVSLFPFLHGSLFYLYVRSVIHGRGLGWGDLRHALGFIVALALIAELLLMQDGLSAAIEAYRAGAYRWRENAINLGLFSWSLSYVAAAVIAIVRHRRRLRATRSDSHPDALRWLVVVAACQCLIWAIALGQWLPPLSWLSHRMIYVAVAAWVLVVGYASLLRPRDEAAAGTAAEQPETPDEPPAEDFEDPRFDEVAERLRLLMEDEQVFREPAFSIARLARRSGYPEYLVSAVLNRRFGCPFWDYVNRYRVEAARARLLDPDETSTALEIAYDCGFTSKSTFNAAFKRLLGQTPSACRQRAGAANADAAPATGTARPIQD